MAKTEPTIITLTLQPGGGSQRQGSLLIARGDLANLSQFTFSRMSEITDAITQAANALAALEIEPPDLTVKVSKPSRQKQNKPTEKKPKTERKISLDDPPNDEPEAEEEEAPSEPEPEAAEVEDDPDDLATLL